MSQGWQYYFPSPVKQYIMGGSLHIRTQVLNYSWDCIMLQWTAWIFIVLMKIKKYGICIGNHMISNAIWNKYALVGKFFQRRPKLQFVVFEKSYKCLFIPNCTRKIMWLLINNIHEKIWDGEGEETHVYHAIREKLCHKLCHPGRVRMIWKQNIWLVLTKPYCLLANHNPEVWCAITLFALCYTWTALLSANQNRVIFHVYYLQK